MSELGILVVIGVSLLLGALVLIIGTLAFPLVGSFQRFLEERHARWLVSRRPHL